MSPEVRDRIRSRWSLVSAFPAQRKENRSSILWMPGVAQVAMQQGRHAGKVLHHRLAGSSPLGPFSCIDKGNTAVVGKGFAVLQSGTVQVSGFGAWLAWAFIHLQFLAT